MRFKFLVKVTRDHFVPTKFEDWRGKIHFVNICIGEEGIWIALECGKFGMTKVVGYK